ncbi:PREDICTED: uncharacterized protein LOC108765812 [Trachymyrmex cornetzi]|uniref:uncharacterized protein LOC108765812 n=1 Tax=Trachymyrmex cornetzi TaxID=471704 RepID=UPI00084F6A95|nr:PREDICTED: uncharacterized protein LOC108765812 [Trachymyrmex cornetzi]
MFVQNKTTPLLKACYYERSICSIHFESSCFEKSLQQQLLGYSPVKVRKLRSDAIPTLYLCNESPIVTNIPSLIAVKELDTLYIDNVPEVDSIVNATPITSTATTDLCSRADDVNSIQNLQWELAEMKKKLQKYDEKEKLDSGNHQQQITALKEKLAEYKQQQNREHEMFKAKMYDILSKVFTPGQIRSLLNPSRKRVTWSSEDIASALSLRSVSPRAYRYLRNIMKTPLPALSTLRRWASNINIEPSIMNAVLDCMKVKGKSIPDFEKLKCCDNMGEVHIVQDSNCTNVHMESIGYI